MKVRNGFISNSSSSSFVVAIKDIPNPEFFESIIKQHNDGYGEGYIYIGKKYYHGRLDQHDVTIRNYLGEHNIFYEDDY